jgi:hypothetical protein
MRVSYFVKDGNDDGDQQGCQARPDTDSYVRIDHV